MKKLSKPEETFALHVRAERLPVPKREHRFEKQRRWRLDFAWPDQKIAVEIQGGTWSNGAHVRGQGYENDRRKINSAVEQGWKVFEYTFDMVIDGTAIDQIKRVLT